jgi:hypothetical protein
MLKLFPYNKSSTAVSNADLVNFVDDKEHTISAINYHSKGDLSC